MPKLYLSSTLTDLGPERLAVKQALGGECVIVESYVADERSLRDSCLADVAACDLYVGIIGLRYGFVPKGQDLSITELEYREARRSGCPALIFIKDEDSIVFTLTDDKTLENPPERIKALRAELADGSDESGRVSYFKSANELKANVLSAYFNQEKRRPRSVQPSILGNPYPGLRAFKQDEADRFFGRDTDVDTLLSRLLISGERFVALVGPSGSGKSSLVHAGLIPKLCSSAFSGGSGWIQVAFTPGELGDDPFLPLAQGIAEVLGQSDIHVRIPELTRQLREDPSAIIARVESVLANHRGGAQVLLFVDQFEEVFSARVDGASRRAFFDLLAVAAANALLRVVVAMRSDFYHHWPQDEGSIALLRAGHFPVSTLGLPALYRMIVGPAEAAGLVFDPPGLCQRILDDTGTAPGALALAQFALAELFRRKEGNALTAIAYEAIGGVAGAVQRQAEVAVNSAEDELRCAGVELVSDEAWSRLFRAIAAIEDRSDDTGLQQVAVRRRFALTELQGAELVVARHLVEKRLLVSSSDASSATATLEVGHEAVFTHWVRFVDWQATHGEQVRLLRQVERAAVEWEKAGRRDLLRWSWERQKPALDALRQLDHLATSAGDTDYADTTLAAWHVIEKRLGKKALCEFLLPEPLQLLAELDSNATTHQRREEVGLRLAQLGDPRHGVGLDSSGLPRHDWVNVLGGDVTIDAQEDVATEYPLDDQLGRATQTKHACSVQPFKISRYLVTWAQFRAFLDADDGHRDPRWWGILPRQELPRPLRWTFPNHPVIQVSWFDAIAYCKWLQARLGCEGIRLPTEREWQWAAAGPHGQEYPWTGAWDPSLANTKEAGIGRTMAVGMYPGGRSHFGCLDMAGNVREWCLNGVDDLSESLFDARVARVLRGGSWGGDVRYARTTARDSRHPHVRGLSVGFRVCLTDSQGD